MINVPLDLSSPIVIPPIDPSEIHPPLIGVIAHNALPGHSTPSRLNMESNHIAQAMALDKPEKKESLLSGVEYGLGEHIDDIRVHRDCKVIRSIRKLNDDNINPETILIVECITDSGRLELDMIRIPFYRSKHSYFGYPMYPTDLMLSISHGTMLKEGDVLCTPSNYGEDGIYKYGVNANIVYSSDLSTAEDGFAVSKSFVAKLDFHVLEKRTFYLTKDNYMLNLYGDDYLYKVLPNIGDMVSKNELLAAVRERDDYLSVTDLTPENSRRVDHTFDKKCYVEMGSIVVDVKVHKGSGGKEVYCPEMREQIDDYLNYNIAYSEAIVSTYDNILRSYNGRFGSNMAPTVSPLLNITVSNAMIYLESTNSKRKLVYDKKPVDQYRIEVITRTVFRPDIGYKLTDMHGGRK